MKWISVSDRLPEINIRVLICDVHGWIFTGIRGRHGYECSMGEEPGSEITHWMPLPNPAIPYRTARRTTT